jgi:hypothetical protein
MKRIIKKVWYVTLIISLIIPVTAWAGADP